MSNNEKNVNVNVNARESGKAEDEYFQFRLDKINKLKEAGLMAYPDRLRTV